jgi:hypothetical protein
VRGIVHRKGRATRPLHPRQPRPQHQMLSIRSPHLRAAGGNVARWAGLSNWHPSTRRVMTLRESPAKASPQRTESSYLQAGYQLCRGGLVGVPASICACEIHPARSLLAAPPSLVRCSSTRIRVGRVWSLGAAEEGGGRATPPRYARPELSPSPERRRRAPWWWTRRCCSRRASPR